FIIKKNLINYETVLKMEKKKSEIQPRLLIFEDDENILELYCRIFSHYGYEVFSSQNGKNGEELIMKVQPDLIIIDPVMPVVSGMELLCRVEKKKKFENIPIVLVTASNNSWVKDYLKTIESEVPIISKPFDIGVLLGKIEKLLQSAQPVTA
ncbi:response regulator, partial [Candidatus Riflebacteria bacterium]